MPDRYDPKLSARAANDRKATDGRSARRAEDPLVELARIVSGRGPSEAPAAKADRGAAPAAPQPLPSEADLARDLETELLNELQASFSTISDVVGKPSEAPASQAPIPAELKSPVSRGDTEPSAPAAATDEWFRPRATLGQMPVEPRVEPQRTPQGLTRREAVASRLARAQEPGEPMPLRHEQPESSRLVSEPAQRQNVLRPQNTRAEAGSQQLRATLAPNPDADEPGEQAGRQLVTRWDHLPEAPRHSTFEPVRYAPEQGDGFRSLAAERRELRHGGLSEPDDDDADAAFPTVEEAYFDEAPGDEPPEAVPGYGDDELLPYPEEDLSAYRSRRSRRAPLAIAALLTVAVIGGAAAVMLRSGGADDGPPPIITADNSPTKVTPENPGPSEGKGQAKLIYDRVDPGTEIANSQLDVPGEKPVADIPPIPEEPAGNDVSRVILEGPGGEGEADPAAADAGEPSGEIAGTVMPSDPQESDVIGPKKVRTVVVRPDGTIVSSAAAPANAPDIPPASETPPAPAANENPLLGDNFAVDDPGANAPAQNATSTPAPSASAAKPAPVPRATPPVDQNTVVAATGNASAPLDVTPGGAATTPSPSTGGGGGFLVQVSSQRSQDTAVATFRELQRRYPNILGDRQPDIQRADLGERGVYYRVRVGYATRAEAVRMCENLKAAGGDCILASR